MTAAIDAADATGRPLRRPGPRYALPTVPRQRHTATVVIPCYRYGKYLPEAVRCALAQRHVDMRVVIVDDCSPDDSLTIARSLAAEDSRVEVVAHETNLGHIQTYNDGLARVDTEFVALVSADDLVAPGAIDRAVALMERFPDVGLVYGKLVPFSDAVPRSRQWRGLWNVWTGRQWIESVARNGFNPIISPEAVLRTSALREAGEYNGDLPHSGDLEYWLRVAALWDVGQVRGVVQANYRVHGANMHLTRFPGSIADIEQKMAAFDVLSSPQVSRGRRWVMDARASAARTLSAEALACAGREQQAGDLGKARDLARLAAILAPIGVARGVSDGQAGVTRFREPRGSDV
ncbi:glycosyltransferase family 2 protein [Microbacterium sp. Sa4CUA7]|uniref:Glycosyltransferase family 2 protein n=1 Tax=Microbacterium pullorum TaxID=2762236 RepID=A0ABR8S4Z9_9MICO|nr:glycosyltransferase family 2 protein [Microbacterium pullorum]MBD7958554.1 glycosyltransferase family 2 protein [Microbacterium pullorum]